MEMEIAHGVDAAAPHPYLHPAQSQTPSTTFRFLAPNPRAHPPPLAPGSRGQPCARGRGEGPGEKAKGQGCGWAPTYPPPPKHKYKHGIPPSPSLPAVVAKPVKVVVVKVPVKGVKVRPVVTPIVVLKKPATPPPECTDEV